MTIGQALKDTRKALGLTQTEMAAGIVSPSFYSKVERGVHDIGADELLAILNANDINYTEFFGHLKSNNLMQEDYLQEINQAYQHEDKNRLISLKKKILSLPDSRQKEYYLLQLHLTLEVYLVKADKIPKDLIKNLKNFVFQYNEWDAKALQIFRETMRVYDLDELSFLINSILGKYPEPDKLAVNLQEIIGAICVNYLDICYEFDQKELISRPLLYLKKIPASKQVLLIKILANYYEAIFSRDSQTSRQIFAVLKNAGWEDFVKNLPQL